MNGTRNPPRSEAQIARDIDTRLRRSDARSHVMRALRERAPRTAAELREYVADEMGNTRRRVTGDVGAALRSLQYRQLIHSDADGWRLGSTDTRRRRRPLSVRGPCERCGELHVSGPCPDA